MLLTLYGVRDNVTNETGFIFPAKNEKDLRRTVKSAIAGKSPVFCDNVQDKQIYAVAHIETLTGKVDGMENPVFIDSVQSILDELILDLKIHNQKMKDAGLPEVEIENVGN